MIDSRTSPYAALVLRVSLGVMFVAHGPLKAIVFTLPGTANFFESVGFPGFLAYIVTPFELVAGALLILGVQTRVVALASVPLLLGAALVHFGNGWLFSSANGGWEYPVLLIVLAIVQAMLGDGAYALKRARPALCACAA
jgi:putative oxidoreductase